MSANKHSVYIAGKWIEVKDTQYIHKVHLIYNIVYLSVIFGIIVLCIILTCHYSIAEIAFHNFSFASTIVSIVLAVVSICYTLYSGWAMAQYFGNLSQIETRLHEEVNNLKKVQEKMDEILKTNEDLKSQISEMQETMKNSAKGTAQQPESIDVKNS